MILDQCKTAVEALRTRFPTTFQGQESPSDYALSAEIDPAGLKPFALTLLDARFSLTLSIAFDDNQKEWSLNQIGGEVKALGAHDSALEEMLGVESLDNIELEALLAALARSTSAGLAIKVILGVSLTKTEITSALEPEFACALQKVVVFLFAENFIANLNDASLSLFEESYSEPKKRTTIILLDYPEGMSGDFLVVCGPAFEKQLGDWVCTELAGEAQKKVRETLEFRKSQSLGDFRTEWITPEFFALSDRRSANSALSENILKQLRTFQALLSILFLADFVEDGDESFRVEYRGRGATSLPVNRSSLLAQQAHLDSVYDLYVYAYQEFHIDKLEVAQQLLSLMAASLESLCARSGEIKEATKQAYSGVLREKVSEYFAAVEKLEERLKTAVGESAQSVLGLTKEVSEDLYKIAGVIAGAVVATLIEPDLSGWVGLGAGVVIASYLVLVIFYHLATLERTFRLSMDQHHRYIESFRDIVGATKVQGFLDDAHLQLAKALFEDKRRWAERIYGGLLLLSLLVAYGLAAFVVIEGARRAL